MLRGAAAEGVEGRDPAGGKWSMLKHAPDTEPDEVCHKRHPPADRNWMGRPSPECRSRLTSGKSPVRESRTPGSVGEVPGNRHLYPTTVDLQIRQSGHALQGVQSVRKEHGIGFRWLRVLPLS